MQPSWDGCSTVGVLMELLQNADDAGASRVCLMLDSAQHPTNSVLGPEMAVWQARVGQAGGVGLLLEKNYEEQTWHTHGKECAYQYTVTH